MSANTLFFALLGGILPALLWLSFWLKEDRLHPEPRRLILKLFFAGCLAAILALPLQRVIAGGDFTFPMTLTLWVAIEEGLKFAFAYITALRKREFDEPIDALVYLITAALGFAALENTLFLVGAIGNGGLSRGLDIGNIRFIGATLLHVVSSGTIGLAVALSFYKRRRLKEEYAAAGFILAVALHTLFNWFIIKGTHTDILMVFASVWVGAILLLIGFEKVKRLRGPGGMRR